MARYTTEDLEKKYAGFVSPGYSIKINGTALRQEYCKGGLRVELTAGYEASGCSFQIYNAYLNEQDSRLKLAKDLERLMKLGNKVEISAGYRSGGAQSLFTGYIDSLETDYDKDGGIVLSAECLDGKGIMMNSLRSERKIGVKKYSQAVEDTLKKYASLFKVNGSNLDKTDKELSVPIEQHLESDYDFVVRLAKKLNYCFFIEKGEVIFRPVTKLSKESYLAFSINHYMFGFRMTSSLKNQVSAVIVRGNNEQDPTKPFEGKATSYKSLTDGKSVRANPASVINHNVTRTFSDVTVDSAEKAKDLAEAKLNELSYGLQKGFVKTAGLPEALPGKVAEIIGFGDSLDKKYFITKVIHTIKNDRFTTVCELEGNDL